MVATRVLNALSLYKVDPSIDDVRAMAIWAESAEESAMPPHRLARIIIMRERERLRAGAASA